MEGAIDDLEGLGDVEEEFSVGGVHGSYELGTSAPVNLDHWLLVNVVDGPV